MDDTEREARLFEYAGTEIAVRRPTDSQMFALAALHNNRTGVDAQMKVVRRMFKIAENLVTEEGYEVIEDALIDGTASPMDFANFLGDIFKEDWSAAPAEDAEPEPAPAPVKAVRRAAPRA